jgi:ribosomal protein L11 methyltransferase
VEIDVRLGSSPLPFVEKAGTGLFDLILANIHRNVLLANMPSYAAALTDGGELWISGFYQEDCSALRTAAEQQGLTLIDVQAKNEWQLMKYRKEERL